jgi:Tudor domain
VFCFYQATNLIFLFTFVLGKTDESFINMSSGEWLFVHFTHVEDGLRGRQGPYLNFWGQKDRSTFLHLENTLGVLSPFLIAKPPPTDLHAISGQIIVVLINNALVRGRIVETTPSPHGLVDVFCIDLGSVQSVPQAFIRTLDVASASAEAILVAQCQPLAQKYFLAEVVCPQEIWPDQVIRYAKAVLENQSWKANLLGNHGGVTEVRLYNNQNVPLAQTLIEYGMGIPAPQKVPMVEASGASFQSSNFARPVLQANLSARGLPAQTLPARIDQYHPMKHFAPPMPSLADQLQLPTPSSMHVGSTRSISPQLINQSTIRRDVPVTPTPPITQCATAGQTSSAAASSGRSYIASEMKLGMPYEVIVTNIEDGVRKFSVQLKESEAELQELRRKLDCVPLRPMKNPSRARPCLALFSQDNLLHRGLVTNCFEDKCSVYYIDYGNIESLDSRYIFEIPDEIVDIKLLACRCSLADSDDLEHLNGVAEAFASIVPGKVFKCEVVDVDRPQKVFLYDEMGRSVKDLIISALGKGSFLAKKSFSPSQHLVSSVRATSRREQVLNGQLAPSTSRVSVQVMIRYLIFYLDTV